MHIDTVGETKCEHILRLIITFKVSYMHMNVIRFHLYKCAEKIEYT